MSLTAFLDGIGVLGPGISDWPSAAECLRGRRRYEPAPTAIAPPAILPSTERRRTGRIVQLALTVAIEATTRAGIEPGAAASVFSSSSGEGSNCHEICAALAAPMRELSPTRFTNSVHNAASGYWSIAAGATGPSNVLCAYDASFSAGLLEAMVQISLGARPVLLVAYDGDYPEPLKAKRPIPDAFGVALVLSASRSERTVARIRAQIAGASAYMPADSLADSRLDAVRASIPAARCLPLLRALALRAPGRVALEYLDASRLVVEVVPCA